MMMYDIRHLSKQTQSIINNRLLKSENVMNDKKKAIYSTSILMKLGYDKNLDIDENDTIKIYTEFCNENKEVWFSTDSLVKGMLKKGERNS